MATRKSAIPEHTVPQALRESHAFRRIAALLGKDGWDDPSALLEVAADVIEDAGFPHPGISDNDETYLDFSNATWEAAHPEAVR